VAGIEGYAAAKGRLAHDCSKTLNSSTSLDDDQGGDFEISQVCASRLGSSNMISKTDGSGPIHSDADIPMMRRCLHLSTTSLHFGELPFAAVICKDGDLIAESTNKVVESSDVTHHAELAVISAAQKILGRADLGGCTLYSIVEPCAMCSFAIRETSIGRVVFSISSPIMGGLSKWNVLRDVELSHALPEVFGPVPEVIVGLLREEAEKVWQAWNPVFWAVIKNRGYLGGAATSTAPETLDAIPESRSLLRRLFALHKNHPA
jgi:tRNA(adenine34) deaminase